MKVKIKCKCGKEYKISVDTLKKAREVKSKNIYICNVCQYRVIANKFAKQVASGFKW